MAEMSTLNGYEIVDEGSRTLLDSMGEPVTVSENPLPMSGLMGGKYEVVDKKARDKINEILANRVQDGYTVNFFDSNNQLIQTTRTKYGYKADLPLSHVVDHWEDINGVVKKFPLTFPANSEVQTLNVYESDEAMTCERMLYAYYGIDKSVYPYVIIKLEKSGYSGGSQIFFLTGKSTKTTTDAYGSKYMDINANALIGNNSSYAIVNYTDDMPGNIDKLMAVITGTKSAYQNRIQTAYSLMYTNYEHAWSKGRLDQVLYTGGVVLPPYSLQAKTAEQGDTVEPDEGYYGLSKVTVAAAPLQEKTVVKNGELIPDDGYYGLSKILIDVPAGAGIANSYTVNFYDHDKNLIETHGAKCSMQIDKPISYEAETWQNISGVPYSFPLTVSIDDVGSILNLYAGGAVTLAQMLYANYGVDVGEYPYVFLHASSSDHLATLYFARTATHRYVSGQPRYMDMTDVIRSTTTINIQLYRDTTKTQDVVKLVTANISKDQLETLDSLTISPVGSGLTYHPACYLWYKQLPTDYDWSVSYIERYDLNVKYVV